MDDVGVPASEHVVERAGCRLHYWLAGPEAAPLVVLTHGMALDHRMFADQLPALAGGYRVLTWDMRGHGLSQPAGAPFTIARAVDDLLAIVFHAGRQRAVFVGHSLGGIVAQELAFRFPARVVGLAAFGCSCATLPLARPLALALGLAPLSVALLGRLPYWPVQRLGIARMAERREVRALAADMAGRLARATFLEVVAALASSRHGERGYRVAQPLLLLYGERDRYGNPRRAMRAWAARDQHARVVGLPAAGHNANQDNPAAFNRALLAFLASL